jgi:protein disulfide-isomerase
MKNWRGKTSLVPLVLAALIGAARADEQLPVLKAGSEVYSNVTVTTVNATDVYFIYAGGMANVKIKTLSPELQKHFHYDSQKATVAEAKLAENKAQYHQQLLRQPAAPASDRTQPTTATTMEEIWRLDFPGALQQARADHQLVLIDFTGSDWCPWCVKFEHDVLATPQFAAYANRNLQLVRLDFPRHTPQPESLQRANAALYHQFGVDGFPTFILVNADGKELGRQVGYLQGGPDAFIAELEKFSR